MNIAYSKIVWGGRARTGREVGREERQFFCKLLQKLTCSSFRCIFIKIVFSPNIYYSFFFWEKLYNEALANITRNRADRQPVDLLGKIFFRRICLKFLEYFYWKSSMESKILLKKEHFYLYVSVWCINGFDFWNWDLLIFLSKFTALQFVFKEFWKIPLILDLTIVS